jgi:hypothetical protein
MAEQKFTIEEINKGLDIYLEKIEKNLQKMDIVGVPKKLHKGMIQQKVNQMRSGMMEIRVSLEHALKTGKLPDASVILAAQEKAGFIPKQVKPAGLGGKTLREEKMSELEEVKKDK